MLRFLFTAALAAALPAQITTTAYIQDSVRGNTGNTAPFGCLSNGVLSDCRSQILIPAQYLPSNNSLLVGLAAVGNNSSGASTSITYASLKITVSRTSATSLSATFANNLTNPVVVLNATNLTVGWTALAWSPILFTTGFLHDGQSGIVIDIQKVVSPFGDATMRNTQNAGRADLPRMINANGGAGSNAHLATTATVTNNYPLSLELRWGGLSGSMVPTVKLTSDNGGAQQNQFAIGTSVQHIVQGAPGAFFVNLQALGLVSPRSLGGVDGLQWVAGVTMNLGTLPASGSSTFAWVVPNNSTFVGLYVTFQSLVSPPPFTQLRLTNAADCFLRT